MTIAQLKAQITTVLQTPIEPPLTGDRLANLLKTIVDELDDVLEFATQTAFPPIGETGKIYIAIDSNLNYRWGGSVYVQVGGGDNEIVMFDTVNLPDYPINQYVEYNGYIYRKNYPFSTAGQTPNNQYWVKIGAYYAPYRLITGGVITITGNQVTIGPASWRLQDTNAQKNTPTVFTVNFCATGLQKFVVFNGRPNGTIGIIEGVEGVLAVEPNVPINSAFLRRILVTDNSVNTIPEPDLTSYALSADLGDKTNLLTANKTNLVNATNELYLALQIIHVTYTQLVALIATSTLEAGRRYRITDYQTIHTIPNTTVLNTGPVEPLVVTAATNNSLLPDVTSDLWTSDILYYDITNLNGSTKGRIIYRLDTKQNVSFPNDFRYVTYRRWKLNPPAFDVALAYPRYSPVIYNNNIYYVSKPGGFTVSTATLPSETSDDWFLLTNTSWYTATTTVSPPGPYPVNSFVIFTSRNTNHNPRNVVIPIDINNFIDVTALQQYNTNSSRYSNIIFGGAPGNLINNVFLFSAINNTNARFRDMRIVVVGTNTFIAEEGTSGFSFFSFPGSGLTFSTLIVRGTSAFCSNWNGGNGFYSQNNWFNVNKFQDINGSINSCMLRGVFEISTFQFMHSVQSPLSLTKLVTQQSFVGLKFSTNANLTNVNLLTAYTGYANGTTQRILNQEMDVIAPLNNKTFIGNLPESILGNLSFKKMIDLAATASIIGYNETTQEAVDILNPQKFSTPITAQQFKLSALNTAPTSATDTGTIGDIRYTAAHIYICTATNTWVRSALTTW
jgi:hypothetical protein